MFIKCLALAVCCTFVHAVEWESDWYCKAGAFAPTSGHPSGRQYVQDREVDIRHLILDVMPDFKGRSVSGKAKWTFSPIARPLRELSLDAVDLKITSVTSDAKVQAYQNTGEKLVITFSEPVPVGRETSVKIAYSVEPKQGLYFRTPEMGYKPGEAHLFTQGEAIEARHWYPCYDSPNEKFTSEMICHAPASMVVLSNGKLMSEEVQGELKTVRWLQDKPHANYLISLVVGPFKKVEGRHGNLPLAFHVLPSEIDQAARSFEDTIAAIDFFEKEIGVPYPWAKYDQVCVNDFQFGGMENTTISTLTERTLHTKDIENLRPSTGLVAHELAHQWFGDLVTTKDWSHLWLNEGFATFYAALFAGQKNGQDEFLFQMYQTARGLTARAEDARPIVNRQFAQPDDMITATGHLTYGKGSWVLNMLRSELGPELYRKCIQTYVQRHQFGSATTESLNAVLEELSGKTFDRFFDQWVYHGTVPVINASYSWDEKTKLAKFSLTQTQPTNQQALLFEFPLTIRFKGAGNPVDHRVVVRTRNEEFYVPLPEAPKVVRFDPNLALLSRINFHPPSPMVQAELADKADVLGRLHALEELSSQKTQEAVKSLGETLRTDAFYGVRQAASRALKSIHTEEAFKALTNSLSQSDARVRMQVVSDIGTFYRADAYALQHSLLQKEKNPVIIATSLRSLAGENPATARETLVSFLMKPSYQNEVADAAISTMRAQQDPAFAPMVLDWLKTHESDFTSSGLTNALGTIAYLSRNETKRDQVREFLSGYLSSAKEIVRLAAIRSLGTLGDDKSIPALEKFATGTNTPEKDPAEKAVASLRAGKKPMDDLATIRSELNDLQKQNNDLKKDMSDLKKKLDALSIAAATTPKTTEPVKTTKKPKK